MRGTQEERRCTWMDEVIQRVECDEGLSLDDLLHEFGDVGAEGVWTREARASLEAVRKNAMDKTLATKLCSLILSEDYEDWLQAWELLRDHMPASVTTCDALDEMLALEAEEC